MLLKQASKQSREVGRDEGEREQTALCEAGTKNCRPG